MPKVSPIQGNFLGGEISPLVYGRVDSERYKNGLATCLNFIPTLQGGLTRRPGSYYVAEVKNSAKVSRLVEFEFSTTQAYLLEFGDQVIRFCKDYGQILNAGTPYEVATPYLEAHLFELKTTQSADVLYIVHPLYAPRKLTRTSHTAWTLTTIDFLDGPYFPTNLLDNAGQLSCSGAGPGTGITLTATSTTGINGGTGFASTDIGRLIRIWNGTTWAKVKVTAYTDAVNVTVTVLVGPAPLVADKTRTWRLGLWSPRTGYPGSVVFHEDRLFFAGATDAPQRTDGSNSGDYENFSPTSVTGTVTDSHAVAYTLNSNDVNLIRWQVSDEKGLLVGTVAGEWIIRPGSSGGALTPTNVSAKQVTYYGSANIQPAQAGKALIFTQRSARKVRELSYFYNVDGYLAPDMNTIAEHITQSGITQMAYQKEPQSLIWCVRDDGVLIGMTYERDLESLKVGWHRHILGGVSDAGGTQAKVESVAVIPSPDGSREDVWITVQRYINGSVKRYIEYLTPIFNATIEQEDAFFVDGGLTYDSPLTITGVTKANPGVVTSALHGLSTGNSILVKNVLGMTELNEQVFKITVVNANSFSIQTPAGANVNTTSYGTYVSGGEARKLVTALSGLGHLEGQTVSILADGAVQPDQAVSSGALTLTIPAAVVHMGLGYESDGQLLRIDAGAADGTALGKTRRTHRVGLLLHRSLGLKLGFSFEELEAITFRTSSDPGSRAPALFSGIISETLPADYDFENQVCFRQDQPLPVTVLAVMPHMVTQDRG